MTNENKQEKVPFSREDYYQFMIAEKGFKTKYALDYSLRQALADGSIVRIGWNQYVFVNEKALYNYKYSEDALEIASVLSSEYEGIRFRIFEMRQLNGFQNHLIAHNTIFVYVENDLIDYAFDTLRNIYAGRILLKPKADDYYRYRVDNQIVVLRLPSESPKGVDAPWQTRLEKMLVDLATDKLLIELVPQSEMKTIFNIAYSSYLIDENTMFRYAKRKGALSKFSNALEVYRTDAGE